MIEALRRGLRAMSGPYGERPWYSRLMLDRSFRAQPLPEDKLQGEGNRQWLRSQCMDLFRTSPLAHAAVTRVADYATVCNPFPITSDDAWNTLASDFWEDWVNIADYRQRPGSGLCNLTRLAHIADHIIGESFFLFTDGGQLQPIEADRICTPDDLKADPLVCDGIRTNATGIITHYYVCDRKGDGSVDRGKFRRLAAENVVQVVEPWRVDALHGVPRIHSVIQKFKDYEETDTAMRKKVKNESHQFYTSKSSLPFGGGRTRTTGTGDDRKRLVKTDIGMVYESGEGIDLIESKSPNASYTPHMIQEGKDIAAACGMPYEYLMMIFTAGSYNAQKGARLAFSDTCYRRAGMITRTLHQRAWNWRIAKAIKDKELPPAPTRERWDGLKLSEWHRAEWQLPRFKEIDKAKDVSAKSAAWAAGQESLRDQRSNPYQILTDKAEDIKRADEIAEALNKQLKTGAVTWQHIINAGVPGMQVPIPTEPEPDDKEESDDEK